MSYLRFWLFYFIYKSIEKKMRDFFWERSGEGKKGHLVRWDVLSCSKISGGLAVGNIIARNIALIGKWLWTFPREVLPCDMWLLRAIMGQV